MSQRSFIQFCRALPHATEDVKWGKDLVFSIGGKMFAVFAPEVGPQFSFKVTPENFALLTAMKDIIPAPYLARHHWVCVLNPKALPRPMIQELLEESYQLVFAKLPARVKKRLGE